MLEDGKGHPWSTHWETSPYAIHYSSASEGVGQVMDRPASGMIHFLGGNASRFLKLFHEADERKGSFRKVAYFCRPVIHLEVDVGMEIGTPGSIEVLVPDSLQVGRQDAGCAGAVHEQIASVLEIKGDEARVIGAGFEGFQSDIGRQGVLRCLSQVDGNTVENRCMVFDMSG